MLSFLLSCAYHFSLHLYLQICYSPSAMLSISNRTFRAFSSQLLARCRFPMIITPVTIPVGSLLQTSICIGHSIIFAVISYQPGLRAPWSSPSTTMRSSTQSPSTLLQPPASLEERWEKFNLLIGRNMMRKCLSFHLIPTQVSCLVAGTGCAAVAKEVAAVNGVTKVKTRSQTSENHKE